MSRRDAAIQELEQESARMKKELDMIHVALDVLRWLARPSDPEPAPEPELDEEPPLYGRRTRHYHLCDGFIRDLRRLLNSKGADNDFDLSGAVLITESDIGLRRAIDAEVDQAKRQTYRGKVASLCKTLVRRGELTAHVVEFGGADGIRFKVAS